MFCCAYHSSFAIILMGKTELVALFFVFLVSRDCCVALSHGVTGLSAVCECGISRSYSQAHYFLPLLHSLCRQSPSIVTAVDPTTLVIQD